MGKRTGISWTDHTFNPWWGCTEVDGSPACERCYAKAWALRTGWDVWGDDKPRRFFGDKHWNDPRLWNAAAKRDGVRRKVFTLSMGDLLEDRRDLDPWRARLWALAEECDQLDWLFLSKRWSDLSARTLGPARFLPHFWVGTTVEDAAHLSRLRAIRRIEGPAVRFASVEPQLGDLGDVRRYMEHHPIAGDGPSLLPVSWWIVGGESSQRGLVGRGFDLAWPRSIRDQCRELGAAFFLKQAGATPYDSAIPVDVELDPIAASAVARSSNRVHLADRQAGADPSEWPVDLQIQEFPGGIA